MRVALRGALLLASLALLSSPARDAPRPGLSVAPFGGIDMSALDLELSAGCEEGTDGCEVVEPLVTVELRADLRDETSDDLRAPSAVSDAAVAAVSDAFFVWVQQWEAIKHAKEVEALRKSCEAAGKERMTISEQLDAMRARWEQRRAAEINATSTRRDWLLSTYADCLAAPPAPQNRARHEYRYVAADDEGVLRALARRDGRDCWCLFTAEK